MELSVVIPIFNEEEIIPKLHQRLTAAVTEVTQDYELIFVNDGSKDHSLLQLFKIAETDKNSKYISFSRNFGHQIAVTAGLDHSIGKAVVIIDGDLQDPPELIPELYKKHKEGFEVVYAQRRMRAGENFFKKTTAKWFYRILRNMTSIDIPVDTGDFRLIDRTIVEHLKKMPEQNKFLRGQIAWMGFRQTAVSFDRKKREHGKSSYPLSKMLQFSMDGITGFSDKPLVFVTRMGLFISAFSFLVILYAIFSHYFLKQTITGWTSLIISSMFIGGVQLLSIGIIGEYIRRINNNTRDRPLYLIQDTNIEK